MRERGRGAGLALRIALAVIAVLVLLNGIVLLCETDPKQFYANLFGVKPAATEPAGP